MLAPHSSPRLLVLVLVLCGACGGSKPPPKTDTSESSDTSDSTPPTSDADSGTPPPSDTPSTVACVASDSVCAEQVVSGAEAAGASDNCKTAKGEPHDGECGHDNVAGTCAVDTKKLTLYYYKGKNAKATRGLLKTAASSCNTLGGTFTPTKPAGGKKKKPAKTN